MFRRQNYDFPGGIYIAFFPTFQAHSGIRDSALASFHVPRQYFASMTDSLDKALQHHSLAQPDSCTRPDAQQRAGEELVLVFLLRCPVPDGAETLLDHQPLE